MDVMSFRRQRSNAGAVAALEVTPQRLLQRVGDIRQESGQPELE